MSLLLMFLQLLVQRCYSRDAEWSVPKMYFVNLLSFSEAVKYHLADSLFFSIPGTSDSSRLLVENWLRLGLVLLEGE